MLTSLRLPTLLRFNGGHKGSTNLLYSIIPILIMSFGFFIFIHFANLINFGDRRDFSKFLYFYSMDFCEILRAIFIHYLLEYTILVLYFLMQFSSHLLVFSLDKVKNFFLKFACFWTRIFSLLLTFLHK